MAEKFEIKEKGEVYRLIREALSALGREDEPRSYGVAPHPETGEPTIYFDLFRISPLQFNVGVPEDADRHALVEKIRSEISRRMEVDDTDSFLQSLQQRSRKQT